MEGMSLPADVRVGRTCGVTAVAVVAGLSFAQAWEALRKVTRRPGNWKGGTRHDEREAVLRAYGVRLEPVELHGRMTLGSWVVRYARPGVRYIVRTTGHVQVVKDGCVTDQGTEAFPVRLYRGRRKIVTRVDQVLEG